MKDDNKSISSTPINSNDPVSNDVAQIQSASVDLERYKKLWENVNIVPHVTNFIRICLNAALSTNHRSLQATASRSRRLGCPMWQRGGKNSHRPFYCSFAQQSRLLLKFI